MNKIQDFNFKYTLWEILPSLKIFAIKDQKPKKTQEKVQSSTNRWKCRSVSDCNYQHCRNGVQDPKVLLFCNCRFSNRWAFKMNKFICTQSYENACAGICCTPAYLPACTHTSKKVEMKWKQENRSNPCEREEKGKSARKCKWTERRASIETKKTLKISKKHLLQDDRMRHKKRRSNEVPAIKRRQDTFEHTLKAQWRSKSKKGLSIGLQAIESKTKDIEHTPREKWLRETRMGTSQWALSNERETVTSYACLWRGDRS